MEEPSIGWIGLGGTGYPLAACLAKKGHRLLVRDADPTRGIDFVEEYPTSRVATSDPDSFHGCSFVITRLPDGKAVNEVLLGELGIAPHLTPGTVVIDASCSSPFDTRALGLELSRLRVDLVDAPITQNHLHIIDRTGATLMVGTDLPEVLEKTMPILKDMTSHIVPTGGLGTAHTMSALNNYVRACNDIALESALAPGQTLGLNPQTMLEVMNIDSGTQVSNKGSHPLLGSCDSGYLLKLMRDVKTGKDVIEKTGFQTELPAVVERRLGDALGIAVNRD